jgi:hypothetical protein
LYTCQNPHQVFGSVGGDCCFNKAIIVYLEILFFCQLLQISKNILVSSLATKVFYAWVCNVM